MATDGGEIRYLEEDDILEAYAAATGCPPDAARDQLRSCDLLASAVARSRSYAYYQDADIALQAAVLAHGIAEGQPFIDGNKRTAMVSMLGFLAINNYAVSATERELFAWLLGLSRSLTSDELADELRRRLVSRQ
jgi:death-on-curing protein